MVRAALPSRSDGLQLGQVLFARKLIFVKAAVLKKFYQAVEAR